MSEERIRALQLYADKKVFSRLTIKSKSVGRGKRGWRTTVLRGVKGGDGGCSHSGGGGGFVSVCEGCLLRWGVYLKYCVED